MNKLMSEEDFADKLIVQLVIKWKLSPSKPEKTPSRPKNEVVTDPFVKSDKGAVKSDL